MWTCTLWLSPITTTTDARYLDEAGWWELLKALNNVELLKRSAREYVEERTAQLGPKRERMARLDSERRGRPAGE